MTSEKSKTKKFLLNRFFIFLRPYKTLFVITLLIVVFLTTINIYQAVLLRNIVDNALVKNIQKLIDYVVIIICVLIINILLIYLRTYFFGVLNAKVIAGIKQRIIKYIQKLSIGFFERNQSGDILSRLTNDVSVIENFLTNNLINISISFLTIIGASAFMIMVSWNLYLVVVFILPVSIIVMHFLTLKFTRYRKNAHDSFGKANSLLKDTLEGDRNLRVYSLKDEFSKDYSRLLDSELKHELKVLSITKYFPVLFISMRFLPFILCSIYGSYLIYHKEITFGVLVAFLQLLTHIVWPMSSIPMFLGNIRSVTGAIIRLEEILESEHVDNIEEKDNSKAIEFIAGPIDIEFKNVHFKYPESENNILTDINLKIKNGKKIAIVGPSGCGKTTILKLLCRFYKVTSGSIFLNGRDINNYKLDSLRSNISIFFQDIFLFPCSIKENIEFGHLGASIPEITHAAKLVNIHNVIQNKKEQYNTELQEHGSNLSTGEQQRIALARTVIRDTSLILLDEPTSSLDNISDQFIQESLKEILTGKTAIIVAHRLSTVRLADEIIVINKGEIVEQGRHQELIDKAGLYKELYDNQFDINDVNEIKKGRKK